MLGCSLDIRDTPGTRMTMEKRKPHKETGKWCVCVLWDLHFRWVVMVTFSEKVGFEQSVQEVNFVNTGE